MKSAYQVKRLMDFNADAVAKAGVMDPAQRTAFCTQWLRTGTENCSHPDELDEMHIHETKAAMDRLVTKKLLVTRAGPDGKVYYPNWAEYDTLLHIMAADFPEAVKDMECTMDKCVARVQAGGDQKSAEELVRSTLVEAPFYTAIVPTLVCKERQPSVVLSAWEGDCMDRKASTVTELNINMAAHLVAAHGAGAPNYYLITTFTSITETVLSILYAKTADGAAGYAVVRPDGSFTEVVSATGDIVTNAMAYGELEELRDRAHTAIGKVLQQRDRMTAPEIHECGNKWLQANTINFTDMDQLYKDWKEDEEDQEDQEDEEGKFVDGKAVSRSAAQSARALQAFEDARLRKEKRAQEAAAKKAAAKQRKKARRSPPPAPIGEPVLAGGLSAAAQAAAAQKAAQQKATAAAEEAALLQAQAKKQQKRQKSPTGSSAPPSAAAQHRLDQAKKAAKKAKKRK
jgi:hypothetical protein